MCVYIGIQIFFFFYQRAKNWLVTETISIFVDHPSRTYYAVYDNPRIRELLVYVTAVGLTRPIRNYTIYGAIIAEIRYVREIRSCLTGKKKKKIITIGAN